MAIALLVAAVGVPVGLIRVAVAIEKLPKVLLGDMAQPAVVRHEPFDKTVAALHLAGEVEDLDYSDLVLESEAL
jgi:hypothetical protein